MPTNWKKAPLSEYDVHKVAEGVDGYNYYGYVHSYGQVIIMRETIATGDILYADGRFDLTQAWTDKVTLDYKLRNQI